MRYCWSCKQTKNASEFNKSKTNRMCKLCQKNRFSIYYKYNNDKIKSHVTNKRLLNKKLIRKTLVDYLATRPCSNCGVNDMFMLELHHIKNKKYRIANMTNGNYSLHTLQKELEKCVVLCSNCHRRTTAQDMNWHAMNKTKCTKCKKTKPNSAFNKSKNKKGITNWCKLCHSEYNKNRYKRFREKQNDARRQRRLKARIFVLNYLETHHCVKCGKSDPIVLEFDHLKNKNSGIANMIIQGRSEQLILEEIKKCQILCANCHRKKSLNKQGSYKTYLGK